MTGDIATAAVDRLGLVKDQVIQEFGWDDDIDDDFRAQVVDAVGGELEDEDYTGVVDHVLLWWRDGDGDLTDALVDSLGTLEEGGSIVLVTPTAGQDGEVDPAEVEEAASTAGLHTSGTTKCGQGWVATRLVSPRNR
ncbi:DUF3052 domain-containing protein [Janibacter sp. YIM B02568]|uniref:DUF3052 domain-containing protein n=1 Tax=Janibacter endophyticus TaxID=2806261 RepID=UPI0019512F93|nr:DUF3052 domain-containing protein [Janibacter endophyticus]MBM6546624.1 DUF3052 domain-containing protein [Janibacter endophyticus]